MSLNLESLSLQIAETAAREAHLTGLATLSNEQFDALFLAIRGINALKKKYAKESSGLYSALMQEDMLVLLGIPFESQYLIEKQKLKSDPRYTEKISVLREKYAIDAKIESVISNLIKNKNEYEKTRYRYAHDIKMNYIEEDIDIKIKRQHESEAEFKTKQKLNAALKIYEEKRNDPVYFKQHIIPLIKELKAQEAHKIFVVIANQLSHFIEHNLGEFNQADSQTIAFFALLKELASDLRVLGIVQHVGLKAANDYINSVIKRTSPDEIKKEDVIENLIKAATKKATKKIAEKMGEELGKAGYSNEIFEKFILFMEKSVVLQIPKVLENDFQSETIIDYMPVSEKIEPIHVKGSLSFFDLVDAYSKSKGLLDKASFALDVYESLSAPNANAALIDSPNPAYLFAETLKDDALSYNQKILTEFGKLIIILQQNSALGSNAEKWQKLSNAIEALQEKRKALDESYESLKKEHPEHRKNYLAEKETLTQIKGKLSALNLNREKMQSEITQDKKNRRDKETSLLQKRITQTEKSKMQKQIEELDAQTEKKRFEKNKKYQGELEKIERKFSEKTSKLKSHQEKSLSEFDKNTKNHVNDAIKKYFNDAHDSFFSATFASDKELKDFYEKNEKIKSQIELLENERGKERNQLIERQSLTLEKVNEDHRINVSNLRKKEESSLLKLELNKQKKSDKILKPYRELTEELEKMDSKIRKQESNLYELNKAIALNNDELKNSEDALIGISREYYEKVNAFNEEKNNFNEDTNDLLKKALTRSAGDCSYLLAMQGMIKSSHMKVNALANAAKQLPSLIDEVQLQGMSYDDLTNKILESREIKEVLSLAEEKSVEDRVQENLAQVGAHSIVDAISARTLKITQNFVFNLDRTIKAEQKLVQKQAEIDKKLMIIEQKRKEKEHEEMFVIITVEPKKSSFKGSFFNFFKSLANIFSDFSRMITGLRKGPSREQKRNDKILNSSSQQFIVVEREEENTIKKQSSRVSYLPHSKSLGHNLATLSQQDMSSPQETSSPHNMFFSTLKNPHPRGKRGS